MAIDKAIDSAVLDANLTTVANAIRAKGGTSDALSFPDGFKTAIEAIQAGGVGGGKNDIEALLNKSITEIFSNAPTVGASIFRACEELTTAIFPMATSIGEDAFGYCSKLTTVDFQMATSIGKNAFSFCSNLTTADFPMATSIGQYAFSYCIRLTTLLLRSEIRCTLSNKNAFSNTPINSGTGYIYVPRALVDTYKTATNWSNYADQFRALEDYTVDGTITGALDESKI